MNKWYKADLAFIHDVGFADYALKSAPGILAILEQNQIREGLVVDLGCGSGLWAQELTQAGYLVLGVDISESMIALAQKRVPNAEFLVASIFQVHIPSCHAVTSVGECFNYLFDPDNNHTGLVRVFRRIYDALTPGGVFIFDLAEPGQVAQGTTVKNFTEGEDWIVLVEKKENQETGILTRRIISFRKVGEHYRRSDEVHRQQLYKSTDIVRVLHQIGFQVVTIHSYGEYSLPPVHIAFIARK
ncbi:MAG: methyltransferase domain-containing protein [Goleter apudmare HA4340-LM2]|jgi:SAM-dependent methyltransferase|nr:methyltransferase domain-containing protein [Goleter apudmare HA4340-LM2]